MAAFELQNRGATHLQRGYDPRIGAAGTVLGRGRRNEPWVEARVPD
jgi:hypothetical protein